MEPAVVVAYSGGVDSALVAALAGSALTLVALVATRPRFVRDEAWPHAQAREAIEGVGANLDTAFELTLERFLALQMMGAPAARDTLKALKAQLCAPGRPQGLLPALHCLLHADARTVWGESLLPHARPPVLEDGRLVRVLVPYSKTFFMVDRGRQQGISYEFGKALEVWLNKQHPYERKSLQWRVLFIPVARDELIPKLLEGVGDIAAGGRTLWRLRVPALLYVRFCDPERWRHPLAAPCPVGSACSVPGGRTRPRRHGPCALASVARHQQSGRLQAQATPARVHRRRGRNRRLRP